MDGAGVGGVGLGGVSGIEFTRFQTKVAREARDRFERETDPTLEQIGIMRQRPEQRPDIGLIQRLQGSQVVLVMGRFR